MYFYLDHSLIEYEDEAEFAKIKLAIKCLVQGYLEGKHLLSGDQDVLYHYRDIFSKGDDDTSLGLAELCKKYYSIHSLLEDISFYVEVVKNVTTTLRNDEKGIQIKQMKYDYFNDSSKIQKTNLIVEDYDDAEFYNYICQCKLKNKTYDFYPIDGGGIKTIKSIRQHAFKQKEITISIIDTDKRFAEEVSQKIEDFKKESAKIKQKDYTIFDYLIIEAHEIENLIPLDIINNLEYKIGGQENNKKEFDLISKSKLANDILQFFDLKKGIYKIKTICDNPDYKKYVKEIVSLKPDILTPYNNKFDIYYDHIDTVDGKKGTENNDKGKIFPGLRRDLLSESLKYISNNMESLLNPVLLDYQEKEWTRISNFIYTMCCCYKNNETRN